MQAAGEELIGMAVANKTVVVFKGAPDQRIDVGNEVLRDASPRRNTSEMLPCER
jgi:hypothetical protein